MEAKRKRLVKDAPRWDALMPRSEGRMRVVDKWANTKNTVALCAATIRQYSTAMVPVAQQLRRPTLRETCCSIWQWVYDHVAYERDDAGHEQIRTPARSWADRRRGVDCDDYSVLIGSILHALNIPFVLRVTAYKAGWQHIYPIVPTDGNASASLDQDGRYITIDDVTDQFDYEVPYSKKFDTPMQLESLSGLPGSDSTNPQAGDHYVDHLGNLYVNVSGLAGDLDSDDEYYVDGLGNIFKRFTNWAGGAIKTAAKAVGQAGKFVGQKVGQAATAVGKAVRTVVTTPIRLGILAYMKLNVGDKAGMFRWGYLPYGPLAAKAGIGPDTHKRVVEGLKNLKHHFTLYGGDANTLRMAILTGKGNPDRLVPSTSDDLRGLGQLLAVDPDWLALQQVQHLRSPLSGIAGLEGLQGLGELGIEPVTSSAVIAAAMGVISKALSLLGDAKANDPNDPIPEQYQEQPTMSDEEYAMQPDESQPIEGFFGAQTLKKAGIQQKKGAVKPLAKKPVVKAVVKPLAKKPTGKVPAKPVAKTPVRVGKPGAKPTKTLTPIRLTTPGAGPLQTLRPKTAVVLPGAAPKQLVIPAAIVPASLPTKQTVLKSKAKPGKAPRPQTPRKPISLDQINQTAGKVVQLVQHGSQATQAVRRAVAPLQPLMPTMLPDGYAPDALPETEFSVPSGPTTPAPMLPDTPSAELPYEPTVIMPDTPGESRLPGGRLNVGVDGGAPQTALYVGAGVALLGLVLLSGSASPARKRSGGLSGATNRTKARKPSKGGAKRNASSARKASPVARKAGSKARKPSRRGRFGAVELT